MHSIPERGATSGQKTRRMRLFVVMYLLLIGIILGLSLAGRYPQAEPSIHTGASHVIPSSTYNPIPIIKDTRTATAYARWYYPNATLCALYSSGSVPGFGATDCFMNPPKY